MSGNLGIRGLFYCTLPHLIHQLANSGSNDPISMWARCFFRRIRVCSTSIG